MKTFSELIKEYGEVEYNGKQIALTQYPWIDNEGINGCVVYRAYAIDDDGNQYQVVWELKEDLLITDEFPEDESECCNWDVYEVYEH